MIKTGIGLQLKNADAPDGKNVSHDAVKKGEFSVTF